MVNRIRVLLSTVTCLFPLGLTYAAPEKGPSGTKNPVISLANDSANLEEKADLVLGLLSAIQLFEESRETSAEQIERAHAQGLKKSKEIEELQKRFEAEHAIIETLKARRPKTLKLRQEIDRRTRLQETKLRVMQRRIAEVDRLIEYVDKFTTASTGSCAELYLEETFKEHDQKVATRLAQETKLQALREAQLASGHALSEPEDEDLIEELQGTLENSASKDEDAEQGLSEQIAAKTDFPVPTSPSFDPTKLPDGEIITMGQNEYLVSQGGSGRCTSFFPIKTVEDVQTWSQIPHLTISFDRWSQRNTGVFHLSAHDKHHYFLMKYHPRLEKLSPKLLGSTHYSRTPEPGQKHNTPSKEPMPTELLPIARDFAQFLNQMQTTSP